jgi:hypothetical protein
MPPHPDKKLQANRLYSVPWSTKGPQNCMSRKDILDGATQSAFGSGQSLQICTDEDEANDPAERPQNWPTAGKVLGVPKVVILSSLPFWTVMWESSYFFFPRDVIGEDSKGDFGNYYYFDQWDDVNTAIATPPDYSQLSQDPNYDSDIPDIQQLQYAMTDPNYQGNQVWNNFTNLDPTDKTGIYNAYASCVMTTDAANADACGSIPAYLFNNCTQPPHTRFSQIVSVHGSKGSCRGLRLFFDII